MTSLIVSMLRKLYGVKKVGHCGTLIRSDGRAERGLRIGDEVHRIHVEKERIQRDCTIWNND